MTVPRRDIHSLVANHTIAARVLEIITPPAWTVDALCAQTGPDLFFTDTNPVEAKAICARCDVRQECLDYALDYESGANAGITYRQLDHWCRMGWLHPTDPDPGYGVARRFPADEIQVARWMGLLVRHGFAPSAAADTARQIHTTGTARLGLLTITTATPTTSTGDTAA